MLFVFLVNTVRLGKDQTSVKEVQRVFVVIHEVDALTRNSGKSEQGTGSGAHVVQLYLSDLVPVVTIRPDLHHESIPTVYGQDIPIGCNR